MNADVPVPQRGEEDRRAELEIRAHSRLQAGRLHGLEQEGGIGGDLDLGRRNAHPFERALRARIAHGNRLGGFGSQAGKLDAMRRVQRTDAHGVQHQPLAIERR